MRKITELAVSAFWGRYNFKLNNTEVESDGVKSLMYLHGNLIAVFKDGKLYISDAGWATVTTKERLNGVLGRINHHINQKNFEWHLWDDDKNIEVKLEYTHQGYGGYSHAEIEL